MSLILQHSTVRGEFHQKTIEATSFIFPVFVGGANTEIPPKMWYCFWLIWRLVLGMGKFQGLPIDSSNCNDPYLINQASTVRDLSAARCVLSLSILTIYLGTWRITTGCPRCTGSPGCWLWSGLRALKFPSPWTPSLWTGLGVRASFSFALDNVSLLFSRLKFFCVHINMVAF